MTSAKKAPSWYSPQPPNICLAVPLPSPLIVSRTCSTKPAWVFAGGMGAIYTSDNDVRKRRAATLRPSDNASMLLDPDQCYRALRAHDTRFDGRFFVGVGTTR